MRSLSCVRFVVLAFSPWLLSGCLFQKPLKEETTMSLTPGDFRTLTISAPVQDQQVTVTASSPGVPVDVYVLLEEDWNKAAEGMKGGAPPEKSLASQKKTEQATLEVKIPAKNKFVIVVNSSINNNKNTDVKVKATSK